MFETPDDFNRVRSFYDARLKSKARIMQFHIGPVQAITYQYYAGVPGGVAAKQIEVTGMPGETMINIGSSAISVPAPRPSAS